jgi:MFS family permease
VGFVIAQVGCYTSFLPLLQILVPMKAAMLAPAHKAQLLSEVASLGAFAAGLANLLAGWVSDHTRSRFGRRRPWLVFGALTTALSYGLIGWSSTPLALVASVLVFQMVFNFAFAPLLALIPDRVPDGQKGRVAALASLGLPVGSVVGSVLVGAMLRGEGARFAALAVIVLGSIIPFALMIHDAPSDRMEGPLQSKRMRRRWTWAWPRFSRDFLFVWGGRCLVLTGFSLVQTYLLYHLQDVVRYAPTNKGGAAADMARLAVVFGVTNVAAGLTAGWLSDRVGRRKVFVILGALVLAAAMISLSLGRSWAALVISYASLGCGAGCYYAVDLALVAEVLPSGDAVGRDLGIVNLSNTAPQIAAPAIAALVLNMHGAEIRWLFALAAGLTAIGAAMVAPVRRVR